MCYLKNKIRIILFCIVVILSTLCIVLYKPLNVSLKIEHRNRWGIYNYGQKIEGVKGKKGLDTKFYKATTIETGDKSVIVAIVDTGVDIECKTFEKNNILLGYDFYNNDVSIYDSYLHDYHGTYIATTISHLAPNISILPVKFMESASGSIDDAILAIKFAIEKGAKIINCSWNFDNYNEELYNIIKNNPNVLFVCSAGNNNVNLDDTPIYPCNYNLDNIISVMAIDNRGERYASSGFGQKSVHIAAPGKDIQVIMPENDLAYIDGTSIATSFVTATSALMLSVDATLTPLQIRNVILKSSVHLPNLTTLCISGGCLDAYNSVLNINQ